jgi:hypothetical protein
MLEIFNRDKRASLLRLKKICSTGLKTRVFFKAACFNNFQRCRSEMFNSVVLTLFFTLIANIKQV